MRTTRFISYCLLVEMTSLGCQRELPVLQTVEVGEYTQNADAYPSPRRQVKSKHELMATLRFVDFVIEDVFRVEISKPTVFRRGPGEVTATEVIILREKPSRFRGLEDERGDRRRLYINKVRGNPIGIMSRYWAMPDPQESWDAVRVWTSRKSNGGEQLSAMNPEGQRLPSRELLRPRFKADTVTAAMQKIKTWSDSRSSRNTTIRMKSYPGSQLPPTALPVFDALRVTTKDEVKFLGVAEEYLTKRVLLIGVSVPRGSPYGSRLWFVDRLGIQRLASDGRKLVWLLPDFGRSAGIVPIWVAVICGHDHIDSGVLKRTGVDACLHSFKDGTHAYYQLVGYEHIAAGPMARSDLELRRLALELLRGDTSDEPLSAVSPESVP